MKLVLTLNFLFFIALSSHLLAWSGPGHMMVAAIACCNIGGYVFTEYLRRDSSSQKALPRCMPESGSYAFANTMQTSCSIGIKLLR